MKKFFLIVVCLAFGTLSFAQEQKYWSPVTENNIVSKGEREIIPLKYKTFHLDLQEIKNKLLSAPSDAEMSVNNSTCVVYLPIANGDVQAFKVVYAAIMEEGLANAYPHIKTFSIKGIDDVYANGKLDFGDFGFHAMIRSVKGDVFIDPYSR